jgi:phage baseplate assembly protein gpV
MIDTIGVIEAVIRDQLHGFRTADLGVVTRVYSHESASDKNNCECDVRLRDCGLELKRVPVVTQRIGAVAIPNNDDLVLVQFLHGDIHSGFITGRVYNDIDRPPQAKAHEFIYISPDQEEGGIRRVYLEFPKGNKLLLDDGKLLLEMGKTKIAVNNDGDIEIDSSAKLTISTKGDATVKAGGNLELNATGDVTLQGANVSVKAKANATLQASASTTLKGATVKIAGITDFSAA